MDVLVQLPEVPIYTRLFIMVRPECLSVLKKAVEQRNKPKKEEESLKILLLRIRLPLFGVDSQSCWNCTELLRLRLLPILHVHLFYKQFKNSDRAAWMEIEMNGYI